jgi:hypothetical protein
MRGSLASCGRLEALKNPERITRLLTLPSQEAELRFLAVYFWKIPEAGQKCPASLS